MNKQAWIEYALSKGFESFEIYQSVSEEKRVAWFDHEMSSYVTSHVTGTSFRGIINGKMANTASEDVSDDKMEAVISAMIDQAANITSEDEVMIRKPEMSEETEYVQTWVRPSGAEIQELLKSLEEKILAKDPRIIQVTDLEWEEDTSRREITNSYGMKVEDGTKIQALVAGAAAMENGEVKNDFKVETVHDLAKFDADKFVNELADSVLSKLGAKGLPSGNYPVIFEKDAMTSLFSVFTGMFSGDLIGKGISPLRDKIGEKVFSELVTVMDDPRNQNAANLANYDDEGCPTKTKTLVDHGVFKMALHNTQSAMRMNTESTGNGFKPGYASPVGVHPMNCYIVPGDKSLDELCADMKEGYVITSLQGLHAGVDFVTTNFSLQSSGYYVKDGKRERSVTLVTVAANFLELMNKVVAVGNDLEWSYRSVTCPSIAFSECAVAGE